MNVSVLASQLFRQIFVGIWSTNWPFVLLPLVACLNASRLARNLEAFSLRGKEKHISALLLVASPGLVFCSLGGYALYSLRRAEVNSALCVMVFIVPILIFIAGFSRASVASFKRRSLSTRLLSATCEAGEQIRELANQLGLQVRILPTEHLACMTVGAISPTVVLSSGAVSQLSASELRAVLLHEQVHVRRRDTLWMGTSRFVADCAFFRTKRAEEVARRVREMTADDEASGSVDRFLLASVLVKFARYAPKESYAFAESFAYPSTISCRVHHLLDDIDDESATSVSRPVTDSILLALLFFYPYVVRLIAALWLHC